MKSELVYYDIYPKIVPLRRETVVHIRALSAHARFAAGVVHYVHIIPSDERSRDPHLPDYPILDLLPDEDGSLAFPYTFTREQTYQVWIETRGVRENLSGSWKGVACVKLRVYALEDDLFPLRPWRGNMHMHTCRSDGVETPDVVLAWYRRYGYDFAAVTDHGKYEPSLEGIAAYDGLKLNMKLLPGEEVHSPDNFIHIINFGGDFSVNDLYRADEAAYRARVAEIEKSLPDLGEGMCRFEVAASKWVFENIRRANGLAILCHPDWCWFGAYNLTSAMYRYFLENIDYDVLELINGGNSPEENQMQVSAWYNSGLNGRRAIPEGSDDSHGAVNGKWFNIGKTYVLSPSLERDDLVGSLRAGLCAAVEQYPGENARIYGEKRMVNYFQFLHEEYFPLHDELCVEEGRLMMAWRSGDETAKARLDACFGQIERLQNHLFGQE